MLLKRVTIENFGPFQGTHTLDLAPSHPTGGSRPIILIGGKNGSGKTSLQEAIRLCLHGRRTLGNPRISDYHNYLRNKNHRKPGGKRASQSSVQIAVEIVESGHRRIYEITRSWRDASNIAEELQIRRDGEELQELYADQYQAFLEELMPLGLVEFFFFDGERIQKFAEQDGSDSVIADAIRGLLGLDVAARLQADLTIYVRTRDGGRPIGELQSEVEAVQARLRGTRELIEQISAEHTDAEQRASRLERAIKLQEQRIASEGGDFAVRRDELLKAKYEWQATLSSSEAELRDVANGLLPFSLVPELGEGVRRKVAEESARRLKEQTTKIFLATQTELLSELDSPAFWEGTFGKQPDQEVRGYVAKAVSQLFGRVVRDSADPNPRTIHDLSERDQQLLLASIETSLTDLPRRAASLTATIEEAHHRLSRIELDLQRAPREEVLEPFLNELGSLQSELGRVKHEQLNLEGVLNDARSEEKALERTIRKLTDHTKGLGERNSAVTLAGRVQDVLKSYEQELTLARVEHLSKCVTECYQVLAHKQSLCSRIQFNPATLALTLYDIRGEEVHRPLLSAGEKQILAIAVLWGLGLASGRELPVVIDTPLARLDAEHRNRLLSSYFPKASHQVILLSTDSEIDDAGLDVLRPSLARSLHLRFDSEGGSSAIVEGYFPMQEAISER